MTLVTNESQRVEKQISFSNELMANAACLDLIKTGPVGEWSFGQGIRKAHSDHFFYELRKKKFSLLGINHPAAIRAKWFEARTVSTTQSFPLYLSTRYPTLKDWTWYIRSKTTHNEDGWFREDCTLKSEFGWSGFRKLNLLQGWIVDLNNDFEWVASNKESTITDVSPSSEAFYHQELIKIFLSEDVLGINGRLNNWINRVSTFDFGNWSGLNLSFPTKASEKELNQIGIAADIIDGRLNAHFCLSMLSEDVENIMRVLNPYQG